MKLKTFKSIEELEKEIEAYKKITQKKKISLKIILLMLFIIKF